jgi:hypothetical protein
LIRVADRWWVDSFRKSASTDDAGKETSNGDPQTMPIWLNVTNLYPLLAAEKQPRAGKICGKTWDGEERVRIHVRLRKEIST